MLAHCLTGIRLLLVVPTALAFARPGLVPPWVLLLFLLTAIASDVLDGKVARRHGTASAAGMMFDHGTDFLFVTASLAGAAYAGLVTPWLAPLIVIAFSQYVLDSRFLHRQKHLRMSFIGRWNGILYFVPLVVLALARLELPGLGQEALAMLQGLLASVGYWFAWGLVLSTGVSIVDRALAKPL